MDNESKIAAIAWAAHGKGLRYGEFAVTLTAKQTEQIYRDYEKLKELERAERSHQKHFETPSRETTRAELPPPRKSVRHGRTYSFNTAAAMELYHQGLCDREIGEELGVSDSAIRNWRNRNGLPSKFPHWGWRGGSRKEPK